MKESSYEKKRNDDPWRETILAERQHGPQALLRENISMVGKRDSALLLGDASMVNAKYLLEDEHFERVVDVDSSPTLLDETDIRDHETRLVRVVSTFEDYNPGDTKFDLVYGKSIAFNPKESLPELLERLSKSLDESGIFMAAWAGEGDSFRDIYYSEEELYDFYAKAGFEIISLQHFGPRPAEGLIKPGTAHEIRIVARKKVFE